MDFDRRKAAAAESSPSPAILTTSPLLDAINIHPSYFPTASRPGRVTISDSRRRVLSGEGPVDADSAVEALRGGGGDEGEGLVLRFEPLEVEVECRDEGSARVLVGEAVRCGFRESGITSLGEHIMVAIRCSIRLEVPLGDFDQIKVSEKYFRYLINIANEKMETNRKRAEDLLRCFVSLSQNSSNSVSAECNTNHKKEGLFSDREDNKALKNDEMGNTKFPPLLTDNNGHGFCREQELMLQVETMRITGQPVEKLFVWGQTACSLNREEEDGILIFGGFGGLGRHARRNDLLMFHPQSGHLKHIDAKNSPSPCLGHTSSMVGDRCFVIGGRTGPTEILGDVWMLDLDESYWACLQCSGTVFQPRHRHAAAVVGKNIYIFGGLNDEVIYSDMSILDTETKQWTEVSVQGEWPSARHSHSLVSKGSYLYMFGGYDGKKALGDLYSFNVETFRWKNEETMDKVSPRFSHSMFVYKNYLGVVGGCPLQQECQRIDLFDVIHRIWRHVNIGSVVRNLWIRSSINVVDDDLVIIGGGVSCYAFGTKFDIPSKVCLRPVTAVKSHFSNHCHPGDGTEMSRVSTLSHGLYATSVISVKSASTDVGEVIYSEDFECKEPAATKKVAEPKYLMLQIERKYAKFGKDLLKQFKWLDLKRKVEPSKDGHYICLPVNYTFLEQRQLCLAEKSENMDASSLVEPFSGKCLLSKEISVRKAMALLLACSPSILVYNNAKMKKLPKCPKQVMWDAVSSLVDKKGFPRQLLKQLPTRWERIGDITILPVTSFKDPIWGSIGDELWPIIAKLLGACRLARQGRVSSTGTRDSTLEILVGDTSWVKHHENGIVYSFDATKCMFSSGNLSEKSRMSKLDCRNETVVDLFAGIGYFVLPFLVKARAKLVYACEWNPHAFQALKVNVQANEVADRCIILEGDNRNLAPEGVADRVCLGLLPSSENSWPTAVRALKKEGGVLHVHGNVDDVDEKTWCDYVVKSISSIACSEGRCWDVSLEHLERVKWYGPRIRHLVADIRCKLQC